MMHKPLIMNNVKFFMMVLLMMTAATMAYAKSDPTATQFLQAPTYNKTMYGRAVRDLLDDRQLIVLIRVLNSSEQLSGVSIKVYGQNNTKRECVIPYLNLAWPARRLSHKTVLVPLSEDDKNGQKQVKLLLVNTNNCKYDFAYDVALPAANITVYPNKNSSDDSFTVVMYGKEACQGHDWCRLFFDPILDKFEPLNFDFDFPLSQLDILEPATNPDGYLFIASFTDDFGTYRVRLYDLSKGTLYKELFAIRGYHTKGQILGKSYYDHLSMTWYRIVSSGLSFCWRTVREDKFPNVVHCSRFREDGSMLFNRTIEYPEVMKFYHVETIANGLILLSEREGCDYGGEDKVCSVTHAVVITNDLESQTISEMPDDELLQIKHRKYFTKCEKNDITSWSVRKNDTDGSFEVQYLCVSLSHFSYGAFYID